MKTKAFTLIELLTVIAIIGVLAAILIPVVGNVRGSARDVLCESHLRQIGVACLLYATDHRNQFPRGLVTVDGNSIGWTASLEPYYGASGDNRVKTHIAECPSVARPPPANRISDSPHYSGNTFIFGRLTYDARRVDEISRPSEIVMAIDGRQRDIASGEAHALLDAATYGDPLSPSKPADKPVPTAPAGEHVIDYRHASGSANAVMADGSVRVFGKGTLTYRHFDIRL